MKTMPGRPRSEQSRASILAATFDLLRQVGYERMSIDAIAARASVGKSTIYRWYKNKEELVLDTFRCSVPDLETPNKGSLAADLEELIRVRLEKDPMALDRQSTALTLSALAGSQTLAEAYWSKYVQPKRATLKIIFSRAKERGELRHDADADAFFDMLHGTLLFHILVKPSTSNTPLLTKTIVEQLLAGFGR
jgi:AcrR family transcriptional regulator